MRSITFIPITPRVQRKRKLPTAGPTPPVALMLVSAAYDPDALTLTLVFNRPVNIDDYDGSRVHVDDGPFTGLRYDGTSGAVLSDPVTVVISLSNDDTIEASDVTLDVMESVEIVAADDASPWEGCTNLVLPFP